MVYERFDLRRNAGCLGLESPKRHIIKELERFDPRCGAGYLGLQSATGALLRALGFESP